MRSRARPALSYVKVERCHPGAPRPWGWSLLAESYGRNWVMAV